MERWALCLPNRIARNNEMTSRLVLSVDKGCRRRGCKLVSDLLPIRAGSISRRVPAGIASAVLWPRHIVATWRADFFEAAIKQVRDYPLSE